MTKFERDYNAAQIGNGVEVIKARQAEIRRLTNEGKSCKNSFRRQCIAQEVARLTAELKKIEELF
jgi:hypothetical protein